MKKRKGGGKHPEELLEECVMHLEETFPVDKYVYIFEQRLPNTRFIPDILVVSLEDTKVVCIVEVGYTRPEKLAAYIERGVPDVRWYSKDMVLLSHYTNKKRKGIHIKATPKHKGVFAAGLLLNIKIAKCLGHPPHAVSYGGRCPYCEVLLEDTDNYEEFEAEKHLELEDEEELPQSSKTILIPEEYGVFLYFDQKRYRMISECENFPGEHDQDEEFSWEDVDGEFAHQKKRVFEDYKRVMTKELMEEEGRKSARALDNTPPSK